MNNNMSQEEFLLALNKEGLLIYGTTWLENFKRLQELKKYKEMWGEITDLAAKTWQMWEEFKKKYSDDSLTTFDNIGYVTHRVENFMDEFEQKYFPKPESKYGRINNILEQLTPPGAVIDIKELKNLLIELRDENV